MIELLKKTIWLLPIIIFPTIVDAAPENGQRNAGTWSREFDILRDGDAIGFHKIEITKMGEAQIVRIETEIEVSIAFVTVYRRSELQEENWQNGKLMSFESLTNDDGEKFYVAARRTPDGLLVEGAESAYTAPADTLPATYWSSIFLDTRNLIDLKRGKFYETEIAKRSISEAVPGGTIGSKEYALLEGDKKREFWFDSDGYLIRTQFIARDGSKIDYRVRP